MLASLTPGGLLQFLGELKNKKKMKMVTRPNPRATGPRGCVSAELPKPGCDPDPGFSNLELQDHWGGVGGPQFVETDSCFHLQSC